MSSLRDRLDEVRRRVELAAERAHRVPSEIQIIAVSKTVAPEVIVEAYRLGQTEFGENRLQEFRGKRAFLDAADMTARWHMLGHLQSNKARPAAELFDIIHSVDSVKLARLLDRCAGELGRKLPVLLEVNFAPSSGRSGFRPDDLDAVAAEIITFSHLEPQGLMTVAPLGLNQDELRGVFRAMRGHRDRLVARYPDSDWRHLSMGMSNDFELAIQEGATMVRIGRAIFGERLPLLTELRP